MSTEIKLWQISSGMISPIAETSFSAEHLESELEKWIVACPEILGNDILIIGRQKNIGGVGRLDLLGIDSAGQLVIVELKRDMTPREAVAQALDYASWLDKAPIQEILQIAEDHLGKPLEEVFLNRFRASEMPSISPQNHRIVLIGSRLDAASERIINYLVQRYSVNINAAFFRYAKLPTGQEILARSVLVPESVIQQGQGRPRRVSEQELIEQAERRQVSTAINYFRDLTDGDEVSEELASTYGGSFRYWRKNIDGRAKMLVGVNVSGDRCDTPPAQLDLWIPVRTFAEVFNLSESQAKKLLQSLPVIEEGYDYIVRLKDAKTAEAVANQFRGWFIEYPGFYKPIEPFVLPE